MRQLRIAFLGGGNMARALIAGLVDAGLPPASISVGEPLPSQRERLAGDYGVGVQADNAAAIAGAEVLILAVKPQELPAVLAPLRPPPPRQPPLLLSIAPGGPTATLSSRAPRFPVGPPLPNRRAPL